MAAATTTTTTPAASRPERPLCAYSPRWLSGPTPVYDGLVATVAEHDGPRDTQD